MAAGLSVQVLLGAGLDRGPRIRAMRPKADAFVSAVDRTQNFGRAHQLKVDSSPTIRSYVLFDVDPHQSTFANAMTVAKRLRVVAIRLRNLARWQRVAHRWQSLAPPLSY